MKCGTTSDNRQIIADNVSVSRVCLMSVREMGNNGHNKALQSSILKVVGIIKLNKSCACADHNDVRQQHPHPSLHYTIYKIPTLELIGKLKEDNIILLIAVVPSNIKAQFFFILLISTKNVVPTCEIHTFFYSFCDISGKFSRIDDT